MIVSLKSTVFDKKGYINFQRSLQKLFHYGGTGCSEGVSKKNITSDTGVAIVSCLLRAKPL